MKALKPGHPILRTYREGNSVVLLKNGVETFPSMLQAIQNAKKTICFETYILRADRVGEVFAAALIERAQQGVEVNLIYDALGSIGLSYAYIKKLRNGGVRVVEFHPLFPWWKLGRLNQRNHRKSLIVDSAIAFVGGINIADEYSPLEEGGGGWRDTHMRIEGPAAVDLEQIFLRTWLRSKGAKLTASLYGKVCGAKGSARVRIVGNRLFTDRRKIRSVYLRAIALSEKEIQITNAYFLPDPILIRALKKAAKRGVKISILFGGTTSDVPWVGYAGRAILGKLIRRNISIYEWQDKVLHSKTAVVDSKWATVGSYNLDYRSLLHNLEVNAGVLDDKFADQMSRMFAEDLQKSRLVTLEELKSRTWTARLRDWIAYRFRFLL